jgi:hypothetical protein
MTTSSQHHRPAGQACFWRRTAVAPMLPNADYIPPSMPKSPQPRQQRPKTRNPDRRSAVKCAGQRYPRRGRRPIKSP